MRTLQDLKSLLAQQEPARGVIVSTDGTTAKVATSSGLITVQVVGAVTSAQQVTIRNGIAYPRQTRGRLYRL